MAEMPPTTPKHSGDAVEEKPLSSTEQTSASPVADKIFDTAEWLWKTAPLAFVKWCRENVVAALALAGVLGTLIFFFAEFHPFCYNGISTVRWAWRAWNPESPQSHGRLVPLIALFLLAYHRNALKAAPKGGYILGLLPLAFGLLLFVAAVRCLNQRMALASIPFLLYGITNFVWGRAAARVILFPCAFLVFMIPVGALEQATNSLQFIITGAVGKLSHLFGVAILATVLVEATTHFSGAGTSPSDAALDGFRAAFFAAAALTAVAAASAFLIRDRDAANTIRRLAESDDFVVDDPMPIPSD